MPQDASGADKQSPTAPSPVRARFASASLMALTIILFLAPFAVPDGKDDTGSSRPLADRPPIQSKSRITLTLEQVRAPKEPTSDPLVCSVPLKLNAELAVGKGNHAPLFVTIHGCDRRQVWHCDRVTVWKRKGSRYQQIRVWDSPGGADDLRIIHFRGHPFLHVRMTSPSAGHVWMVDKLLYVSPDYTLHDVAVDRTTNCGKLLPPLNDEQSEYGGSYSFSDNHIRFRKIGIEESEGPDSEDIGVVYRGAVVIQGDPNFDTKTGQYRPTFTLRIISCERLTD